MPAVPPPKASDTSYLPASNTYTEIGEAPNFEEEDEEEEEEGGAHLLRRHFRRPVMSANDPWREEREGRGLDGGQAEPMEESVSALSYYLIFFLQRGF